jgi:transmembrane sensor
MPSTHDEERLRQDAALWFARQRGPDAAAHRDGFAAWMSEDLHRRAYERLERRWEESVILGQTALPRAKLGSARRSAPHRGVSLIPGALSGLAACLLVLLVLAWRGPDLGPGLAGLDPMAGRLSTRIGEIKTVRLDDGATLTLDTDSAVLTRISAGERHVRLMRGRGRFSVAPRSTRPLIVDAGETRVRAGRTTFDLSLTPAAEVDVALLDGAVEIGPSPWARRVRGPARPRLGLAPGQSIRLRGDQSVARAGALSALAREWPSGWMSLDNTALSEAVADANRYSVQKIELDDTGIGALRVTGAFKATATRRLADGLAATFHLQVVQTPTGALRLARRDI